MRLLEVEISEGEGAVEARLSGELDLSTVGDLESRADEALQGQPPLVVLDLREVTFLDSSGLRWILRLDRRQRDAGGRLVVVRGGRRVARVLELTGAADELELVEDPTEVSREQG